MIRPAVLLPLLAALLGPSASAFAQIKPKHCLTQAEMLTEQLVRHGVFLREAGTQCEEFTPGTGKKWETFDQTFGQRLKQQTEKRFKIFQREFKDDWVKVMTYFDGRLVTYHRHFPLTPAYCQNVDKLLDEVTKKGWKSFATQAKTVQNQVIYDYKICR